MAVAAEFAVAQVIGQKQDHIRPRVCDRGHWVADSLSGGFEPDLQVGTAVRLRRIIRTIDPFIGISHQLKQLGFVRCWIVDQLPFRCDQRPLHVAVGQQQLIAEARLLVTEHRREALAFALLRCGHASQIPHRGREVVEITEGVSAPADRHARPSDHRRRPHRVLVEVLLAEQPMAAEGQTVIAREENDRVVEPALRIERCDHTADLRVHALDAGIVVGQSG